MKKLLPIIFVLSIFWTYAQQVPLYNHSFLNTMVYNPAEAGKDPENINVYLTRNNRFVGYGTGATNYYLTVDGPFIHKNGGFGLQVFQGTYGITKQFGASFDYAYHLKFNEDNGLSLGINAGVFEQKMDLSKINAADPMDPYLYGMKESGMVFNASFGLTYRWKKLNVELGVPQMLGNRIAMNAKKDVGYFRLARHYFGRLSYEFDLLKSKKLAITPIFLARYIPRAPFNYEGGFTIDYKPIGWINFNYRSQYSIGASLGFRIAKSLYLGYSYEYPIVNSSYLKGFHQEIMLGYKFHVNKNQDPVVREIEKIKEVIKEIPDKAAEEAIRKLNDSLRRQEEIVDLLRQELLKKLRTQDSLAKVTPEDTNVPLEKSKSTEGDYFTELDDSDTPGGFFVINGAFGEIDRAQTQLKSFKKDYKDVRIIYNHRNHLYYVVMYYSNDESKAARKLIPVRTDNNPKAWLLKYSK